jgi:hypothetical protein
MWPPHLTRREFLKSSTALVGLAGATQLGATCVYDIPTEGIYTSQFTYRHGIDTVVVYASIKSGQPVPFEIRRIDNRPYEVVVRTVEAVAEDYGNIDQPGRTGAGYLECFRFPSGDLEPGVYCVHAPPEALREENRQNTWNGFPSINTIAYFVITTRYLGSTSRILWVHDPLTGTAYGGFGGHSIYPTAADEGGSPMVSYARPGLDRAATWGHGLLWQLRRQDFEFEYSDIVDLSRYPGILGSYDLVCFIGQFEYMPNEVLTQIETYLDGGGNLFVASNEFGIFRTRLEHKKRRMTTHKWKYLTDDPYYVGGRPEELPFVAGIGMSSPVSPWETEIIGQTVWPAHRVSVGDFVSIPVYQLSEVGWILEGTGIGEGGVLPTAFNEYASGLCLEFDGANRPVPILRDEMRLPEDLLVWGAVPSTDGYDWRGANGNPTHLWPRLPQGFATCTYQRRSSGAQVVTLPSQSVAEWTIGRPEYDRMMTNILTQLSVRAQPRSTG